MPAPRHAGGESWIHRGSPRCVIAAHADAHDRDPRGIDIRALRDVVERSPGRHFGIVAAGDALQTQCLPLPRAVDRQRVDAAFCERDPAIEDADFLGAVEAVEEHHCRRRLAASTLGRHEPGRQCRTLVRNADPLGTRMAPLHALGEVRQAASVHLQLALAHVQVALAVAEIGRRMQEVRTRGQRVAECSLRARPRFHLRAHRGPLLAPGLVVADALAQPLADLVDLAHRGRAERNHLDR